jgi:hypothetical protein
MDINNFELEVLGLSADGPNAVNFWTIKLTCPLQLWDYRLRLSLHFLRTCYTQSFNLLC